MPRGAWMFDRSPQSDSTVASSVSVALTGAPCGPALAARATGCASGASSTASRRRRRARRSRAPLRTSPPVDDRDDDDDRRHPAVDERGVAIRVLRQRTLVGRSLPAQAFHASSPASASTAATSAPLRIDDATASMSPASGRSSSSLGESDRTNARAAPRADARLERREELDALRAGEQLDRERPLRHSRAPATPSSRRRSPSRRDPPGPRSSGSSRRSPDARAPCSRSRATRRRTAAA